MISISQRITKHQVYRKRESYFLDVYVCENDTIKAFVFLVVGWCFFTSDSPKIYALVVVRDSLALSNEWQIKVERNMRVNTFSWDAALDHECFFLHPRAR